MTHNDSAWRVPRPDDSVRIIFGLLMLILWVAVLMLTRTGKLGEADLQWHIKVGEWIWLNAAVPVVDHFSFTYAGQPWIAKEWLSQVLFFWAHSALAWNGVMLLSLLAVGAGAGALYLALSRDLAPMYAVLAGVIGLLLATTTFTVRPHLLTLPLFIAWTHLLFDASRRQNAPHFGLLALILVWANLHAAFTIGFVIAFFAFMDFIERTRLQKKDVLLKWIIFLILCPLVTLIHPYFWKAILATWTVVGPNEAVPLIIEWQPFNASTNIGHHVALLGLIFLTVATGFRLGLAKALLIILLLHLFLTHIRYAYFLFPILAILVAPELARQFPHISAETWRKQPRDPLEKAAIGWFRPVAGSLAGVLILLFALQAFALRTAPPETASVSGAINYAKSNAITGNVMNHYNFGGALIFNGIPSFLDGRTDQLFIDGFVKKFAHGPTDKRELAAALEQYDIQWTLLPPKDARVAVLDKMPGWRLVYMDEYAALHVRE